jgi:hypothetical protein
MTKAATQYAEDFVRWSEDQARALRDAAQSGTNLPLDWDNLAEEVESLGKSQRSQLRSRIATIIEHLLKLEHSPSLEPRRGWIDTVLRERLEIERLLEDSPSLKRELPSIIENDMGRVARLTAQTLELHGEAKPDILAKLRAVTYNEEQVLGEWLPARSNS